MSKYINAETLIEMLKAKADMALGTPKAVFGNAIKMIDLLPPADVVEVVRCKDCRMAKEDLMIDVCITHDGSIPCYDCPCWNDDEQKCEGIDYTAALDLINRQKAEIEKLKSENEILIRNADNAFQEGLNECRELFEPEIKSEAYKEFAEKLENEINCRTTLSREQDKNVIHIMCNLLKEMVGSEE